MKHDLIEDYITVKSRYFLNEDRDSFMKSIEVLASLGQINAIQDYYLFKHRNESNPMINYAFAEYISHRAMDMEVYFTLGLFFEHATFKTEEEFKFLKSVFKGLTKNVAKREKIARQYYDKAIELGKKEIQDTLWDNKIRNAIVCERLAEICLLTDSVGKVYEDANDYASEGLMREHYFKTEKSAKDNSYMEFLFLNNKTRNNAKENYYYPWTRLASRTLHSEM